MLLATATESTKPGLLPTVSLALFPSHCTQVNGTVRMRPEIRPMVAANPFDCTLTNVCTMYSEVAEYLYILKQ